MLASKGATKLNPGLEIVLEKNGLRDLLIAAYCENQTLCTCIIISFRLKTIF